MQLDYNRYTTIKEAIKYSSHPFGLMAIYVSKTGQEIYFINGKPHKIVVLE